MAFLKRQFLKKPPNFAQSAVLFRCFMKRQKLSTTRMSRAIYTYIYIYMYIYIYYVAVNVKLRHGYIHLHVFPTGKCGIRCQLLGPRPYACPSTCRRPGAALPGNFFSANASARWPFSCGYLPTKRRATAFLLVFP